MTLKELKSQIESKHIPDDYVVFKYDKKSSNTFIARQYIDEIAKIKNREIRCLESIDELFVDSVDIFGDSLDCQPYINVFYTDTFNCDNVKLNQLTNLYIITNSFKDNAVETNCRLNTIIVPELKEWQIKDYLYSTLDGVDTAKLDWLQKACDNNIDRVQQEVNKLKCFNVEDRNKLFDVFTSDGIFGDTSSSTTIFNLTNAIARKDIQTIKDIYNKVITEDVSAMSLLVILLKSFRSILQIQLQPGIGFEALGMSEKQYYAIKKSCGRFTAEQLIEIFKFLSDFDRKIKTGEMWMDVSIDYIILKIFGM